MEVQIAPGTDPGGAVRAVKAVLAERFGIGHATIEIDWDRLGQGCGLDGEGDADHGRHGHGHDHGHDHGHAHPRRDAGGHGHRLARVRTARIAPAG